MIYCIQSFVEMYSSKHTASCKNYNLFYIGKEIRAINKNLEANLNKTFSYLSGL